jgi:hypothetical protein
MFRMIVSFVLISVGLGGGLRASGDGIISGPLVVSERWPQATDLAMWTKDVMRIEGLENASETAQGKAFFEWLRLYCRMAVGGMIQAHEGEYNNEKYVLDAHKNLFVYGWGYCDTCSRIADAAWSEYKQDPTAAERVVVKNEGLGFHTMYRLRLDGNYGAFDPRYGYYLIERDAPDARILDWAEVGVDENIHKNKAYKHRSRPFFEYFGREWRRTLNLEPVYFKSQHEWEQAGSPLEGVFGNSHYKMGTRFHDMDFRLPKGTVIERFWDNSARKFYAPVGKSATRELPFLPAGRFYRVTETMLDGNWPKYDPNYRWAKPYLVSVPKGEGYDSEMEGGRTVGQAWGRTTYRAPLAEPEVKEMLTAESNLTHAAAVPYLRPATPDAGGQATFDFYSPYVLVDGALELELAGDGADTTVEVRALQAKPSSPDLPDVWSEWQRLPSRGGKLTADIGRPRFNGRDVSIHGVYRFQVRISVSPRAERTTVLGLNALRLQLDFENGIMALPQIFEGKNKIHFKVRDGSRLRGNIEVTYRYETAAGERTHRQSLRPADFHANMATYTIEAPGLLRCKSVSVAYQ